MAATTKTAVLDLLPLVGGFTRLALVVTDEAPLTTFVVVVVVPLVDVVTRVVAVVVVGIVVVCTVGALIFTGVASTEVMAVTGTP